MSIAKALSTLSTWFKNVKVADRSVNWQLFERFRPRGLSQQVIEQALSLAREQHCYKVGLFFGATRTSAHTLYVKVGFKSDVENGFVIKNLMAAN
ncbi:MULTISPECIES: GNAT family N-acetyltransferase [unclassified Pseudoalteromonas]|uniref:GNAT family N-acetyltransferase n=1 Tax=unclassified Pseudoalteromonas TaxID=194690 RepID=UPI002097710F|nr:GNAT family N-acetyltransferase [Pseudoalteromonas sp. XMcav2-N]MCO7189769.1 GNAT family N-acetyltransferase [Pseudoalteromonas sp. XMcav2-N]